MAAATQKARRPKIDPVDLAVALGQHPPTPEQAAVIAAPLGPTLVVAGAGAGKTETMAARVVWLVANGFVDPEAVLGLTFTRKAAQQLTSRIRKRLARLAGSDVLRALDPTGGVRSRILAGEPEVSTYHAYAGRLLSEHGLLLPIEPSATLLSETELWQVAHRVVSGWDSDLDTDKNPGSITETVLALAGQLAEHLVDPEQLLEAHTELDKLIHTLPAGPKQRGGPSKELLNYLDVQHKRIELLPLVARLGETLRREGALDFGSQMSLSARVASEHPEVGQTERERFRVVLLDEYQDTGHAQRVLLSSLFGGGADGRLALTAVGDPMQSIYGWRGASAANLPRFATDFPLANGKPAPTLELLTSWRNPPEALELANLSSAPLRRRGVAVSTLRARPGAVAGDVRLALLGDVEQERQWVAEKIAEEYEAARAEDRPTPTAAVLIRRNADAAPLAEALRSKGLPVEVVGLGGLLHTPEVADVIAMLRVVADPLAGSAAVRLLTGARWQIGAKDLAALSQRSRELAISAGYGTAGAVTDAEALTSAVQDALPGENAEQAGLVDSISDPGPAETLFCSRVHTHQRDSGRVGVVARTYRPAAHRTGGGGRAGARHRNRGRRANPSRCRRDRGPRASRRICRRRRQLRDASNSQSARDARILRGRRTDRKGPHSGRSGGGAGSRADLDRALGEGARMGSSGDPACQRRGVPLVHRVRIVARGARRTATVVAW